MHAAEQDRHDVALNRSAWRFWQANLHPQRLVFIDESGASTKMTRTGGRAFRGQRVVAKVAHGQWKTATLVDALRATGMTALLVVDGPMVGDLFVAYVRLHLAPTIRPGDTVILDNLSSHKRAGVREAIEGADAPLEYRSPSLNPIELAFAKLKALLRKAAARTINQLEDAIAQTLEMFHITECLAYFRHCGYAAR